MNMSGRTHSLLPLHRWHALSSLKIMHSKNYVVSLDELVKHFFQGSAPQSKEVIPNLFAKVPHFKTEREMYDHFVSGTPTTPLCP